MRNPVVSIIHGTAATRFTTRALHPHMISRAQCPPSQCSRAHRAMQLTVSSTAFSETILLVRLRLRKSVHVLLSLGVQLQAGEWPTPNGARRARSVRRAMTCIDRRAIAAQCHCPRSQRHIRSYGMAHREHQHVLQWSMQARVAGCLSHCAALLAHRCMRIPVRLGVGRRFDVGAAGSVRGRVRYRCVCRVQVRAACGVPPGE